MNIPSFPSTLNKFVDENNTLHPIATSFFTNLITTLQQNFSNEGYVVPKQDSNNISKLEPTGKQKIIYNSDTNKMNMNNNGKFKEIYSRPEQLTSAEIALIPNADINGTWVFNTTTSKLLIGINNTFKEVSYT